MRKGNVKRKDKPSGAALEALERVKAMADALFITPEIASQVLECDPQLIRVQAKNRPDLLGFDATVIGTRVKIPRIPFLNYILGR